ncbi:hypothetical protein [Alteromonas sp. C1M14]|uniref:hypothetical protein n=1 Tax=Alteromonas sp. C1M14 TaxID=2841567 RepID=UPI001C08ED96|nr:hypothetical protein [Alteromonas sp. C1M14]MBU2977699.1 hypothetical protein [Alteromonas sp. C1M14]
MLFFRRLGRQGVFKNPKNAIPVVLFSIMIATIAIIGEPSFATAKGSSSQSTAKTAPVCKSEDCLAEKNRG